MEARTPRCAREIPAERNTDSNGPDVLASDPVNQQRGLAETLADEWVLLFTTNHNKPISDPVFKERYDDIDRQYKELPDHEKTIFNRVIHRGIKDVIATLTGEPDGEKEIRIAKPRGR